MSLPAFPPVDPNLDQESALNMILASIAMEELGLSHIINAEGEKLQYVLGTLPGQCGTCPTIDEVLAVNKSVATLLDSVLQNQIFLKNKMERVLEFLPPPPKPPHPQPCPQNCRPPAKDQFEPCSAVFRSACEPQIVNACCHLSWAHGDICGKCIKFCDECNKIFLAPCRRYLVSFSVNLLAKDPCDQEISLVLNTYQGDTPLALFEYHSPCSLKTDTPITAGAGGIIVDTPPCSEWFPLQLTLFSPQHAKVEQSFLTIVAL